MQSESGGLVVRRRRKEGVCVCGGGVNGGRKSKTPRQRAERVRYRDGEQGRAGEKNGV